MSMVAVATLREAGGAEVAREALEDRGIPVEVKRFTNFSLYFGAPAAEEFEVRVPPEQVAEAQALLDLLSEDMQQRVVAEAGVPAADESDELPPPESRPRKPSWAVAISLISPVPGCGLLYARAFRLGYLLVGLSLTLWIAGAAMGNSYPLIVGVLIKPLDALLAPIFAARFNRTLLGEPHAAQS